MFYLVSRHTQNRSMTAKMGSSAKGRPSSNKQGQYTIYFEALAATYSMGCEPLRHVHFETLHKVNLHPPLLLSVLSLSDGSHSLPALPLSIVLPVRRPRRSVEELHLPSLNDRRVCRRQPGHEVLVVGYHHHRALPPLIDCRTLPRTIQRTLRLRRTA